MPLSIVHINSVYEFGSTGRIVSDIHEELLKSGYVSRVIYGRKNKSHSQNAMRFGGRLSTFWHILMTFVSDRHGFTSTRATRKMIAMLDDIRPDVVHVHNLHGYYLNYPMLLKYLSESGVKVVFTMHDCWCLTGHCAYYTSVQCDRWKTSCRNCIQKRKYPISLWADRSTLNHDTKKALFKRMPNAVITSPSEWMNRQVSESHLQNLERAVIPNGVDVDRFCPGRSSFRERHGLENCFIILGVASIWEKRKGLDYFQKMAECLEPDERIVIVGSQPVFRAKRTRRDQIIYVPRTNSLEDLADIYRAADVLFCGSIEEVLCMTNIEAQACGTPVVAFQSSGVAETVDPGNTGAVAPPGDWTEALNQIRKIKKDGKSSYSAACRKRAEMLYSKKIVIKRFMDLYHR